MSRRAGTTITELIVVLVIISIAIGAFFKIFLSVSSSFKIRENTQVAQLVASSVSAVVASLRVEDFDCTLRSSGIHPSTGELVLTPATDTWLANWINDPILNVSVKVILRNSITQTINTTIPNLGAVYKQERVITTEVTYRRNPNGPAISTYTHVSEVPPLDRKNRLRQNSWRALRSACYNPTNVPSPRRGIFSAVWTGERVIVWGGMRNPVNFLNTGGLYDPQTDTWQATPAAGGDVPSPRNEHIAVWTGTEMIIWGGHNGLYVNTGSRYNPTTNSWTEMSTIGAPPGRCCFVGVWTGSRLLVWGGANAGVGLLNTLGVYDPATNTWLTPAPPNAPYGARNSTAVWTGSEFIVWGGHFSGTGASSLMTNQGAAYNPATNSWRSISSVGSATPRQDPVSAWTGNEMVIWGGVGEVGSIVNGVGRYNPVTDTWQSTTSVNEPNHAVTPSANTQSVGIWSGQNLIIWGKRDDILMPATTTGGWYNPQRDQWNLFFDPLLLPGDPWQSLSSLSSMLTNFRAPTPAQLTAGVWADDEMFVFGGAGGPANLTPLNTYGAFAP